MRLIFGMVGALALACGGPRGPVQLELNDVSVLLPLPAPSRTDALLGLADHGAQGELLPRALYDQLGELHLGQPSTAALHDAFRVVGVRADPCFPREGDGCDPQLRLVLQPVVSGSTLDAALHLFYTLDAAEFSRVVDGLAEVQALGDGATRGRPLEVHPAIRAQGLDGPAGRRLRAVVLEACGAKTLTRLAFTQLSQVGKTWNFGAATVSGSSLVFETVPRVNEVVQVIDVKPDGAMQLVPAPTPYLLPPLLGATLGTDAAAVDAAIGEALDLEHPHRSSPRTADCGSCHVAGRRLRAHHAAATDTRFDAQRYAKAGFDLSRADAAGDGTSVVRAFGYLGAKSAILPRTIHESAEVAAALSTH